MIGTNQKQHWDKLHLAGSLKEYSDNATSLAEEVIKLFPVTSKILELGCGLGNDSCYFAKNGHQVVGIDFSDEAIKQNINKYKGVKNLTFKVTDITTQFPFLDAEFDIVYSRLSLHYFSDQVTRQIFKEIYRVLQMNGLFCLMCKSTHDPLYGKGTQIEKDIYELDGHIRHFFSMEYTRDLLKDRFRIIKLESGEEDFYGKKSGYIKVFAEKI